MHRAVLRLLVAGALHAYLSPDPGLAQVRIHEAVDIVDTVGNGVVSYDNWVVAASDGFVTVALENVDHIDWPIDSSSVLTVTIRDSVFRMPAIRYASGVREASAYIRDLCNGLQLRWVPSYSRERIIHADSVLRVPVRSGDSVKISYSSGVAADEASLTGGDDSWQIALSRTHPCYIYTGCSPCPPIHVVYAVARLTFEYPLGILLGDSRYFELIPAPPPRQIRIRPLVHPDSAASYRVTSPNFTIRQTSGYRSAVYHEARYPTFVSSGGVTSYAGMRNAPAGVLRVVGRRWHKDTSYAVWLRAFYQGSYDSVKIEVIAPDSLGTSNRFVRDVTDTRIDLDSMLIQVAGESGVPPQFLKAMIAKESSFLPQMRYEPFRDAELQQAGDPFYENSSYLVSATSNGNPLPPTNHRFRRWGEWSTTYLPSFLGSIFRVCSTHADSYPHHLYRSVHTAWHDDVYLPIWDSVANEQPQLDSLTVSTLAVPIAERRWLSYLRNKFRGGLASFTAQTRILSSYGLMQMMYFDAATERGYARNERSLPEYLMLLDTSIAYGTRHLLGKFGSPVVREDPQGSRGWREGFEGTFERALRAYNGWSHTNMYGRSVLGLANSYYPRKR